LAWGLSLQADDLVGAVAAYAKLFARCRALNISHPQLYVCHANRAAAFLKLQLFDEALQDAERCRQLAEASFKK
jgi:type III protein arginine methyltransferase